MNHFEESLLQFAGESADLKQFLDRQVELFVDRIGQYRASRSRESQDHAGRPIRIVHVGAQSPTLLLGLVQAGYDVYAEAGQTHFDKLPPSIAVHLRQSIIWLDPAHVPAAQAAHGGASLDGQASAPFDVVIAADNTLADCLTGQALQQTAQKLAHLLAPGGLLLTNIRNADLLLQARARFDGMRIFSMSRGHCIYFTTLEWEGQACAYTANRYLIAQTNGSVAVDHATAAHRAWRFAEINTALLRANFVEIQRRTLDDDRVLLSAYRA